MHPVDVAAAWTPQTTGIPRDVALPIELSPRRALVIQGVRRCGKSTLMAQLVGRYHLDPSRCLFLNFEDPRLLPTLDHHMLQQVVEAFEARVGPDTTYFFDEIQLVEGWQRWLRGQLDRPDRRRFVVSGSNAHLLSGELGSTLTGRYLQVELFPFSFAEFRRLRPEATVETYLHAGGFPEPATAADADLLLRQYFLDIVERDVRERVGARSTLPLRRLVQMAYEGAGAETSLRRLAAALGVAVDTAGVWLDAAESAYLVLRCPFFAWSERKRAARAPKLYPVDPGLRRAVVTRTGADRGKALECATYLALRQRFPEVAYWRGAGEVDFVVEREGVPIPVQVSWDGPQERHHRALDAFYEDFPRAAEPVFVTAEAFAVGLPDLTADGSSQVSPGRLADEGIPF